MGDLNVQELLDLLTDWSGTYKSRKELVRLSSLHSQTVMLYSLVYKFLLVALGFNIVFLLRYFLHSLSTQTAFRFVPGPRSSSLLWGEEWELYHGKPGAPYIDWHHQFGKLVRFTGAFGVHVLSSKSL